MKILNDEQIGKLKKVWGYILPYSNIIVTAVIIAIFFLAIKGVLAYYPSRLKELTKELKEAKEGKVMLKKWEKISKDYEEVKEKFFPEMYFYNEYLEQALKENSINIVYPEPSRRNRGNFTETSLSFSSRVPYSGFIDFIRFLERKNIQIENVIISGQGKEKNITIAVKAFILE